MFIASLFPHLSDLWRALLLVGATMCFAFAVLWPEWLDKIQRKQAQPKPDAFVEMPTRS